MRRLFSLERTVTVRPFPRGMSTVYSTPPQSVSRVTPARSGVMRRDATAPRSGTASSHTACQMPDTGVYHMPWGRLCCLP